MEAPKSSDVAPTHIVRTSGSVVGANALADPGESGVAVLKMVAGGAKPTIVVDYGKDVGGVPYFVVRSESGSPVLRAPLQRGAQYFGPRATRRPA